MLLTRFWFHRHRTWKTLDVTLNNIKTAQRRRYLTSQSSGDRRVNHDTRNRNRTVAIYSTALAIATLGLAYASVPLYKAFCRATGYGGTAKDVTVEEAELTRPVPDARVLKVSFSGQTSSSLPWKFRPLQREIRVVPGETALAFFTAKNESDEAVTGVATYNVTPMKAGSHFHKVQCFCFDEQRLRPNEEVDMPVLFYIAKEFVDDENMADVTNICLSYTFFRSKS